MYIIRILHPYIVDIPHVDRTLGMHLAPDISIGTLANAVRPDDIEPDEVTELTWNPWDITATIVNEYIYIYNNNNNDNNTPNNNKYVYINIIYIYIYISPW